MDTFKMEPDSDDETSTACAFVECQLIEQDPEQATLNKINTEYKEESCNISVVKGREAVLDHQDRVKQSVSDHGDGNMSTEFELCLVKQEDDMSGTLNSSSKSINSRKQKEFRAEKRFKCDVCNKLFTRKYHLKIHHRVHTGEKPFTCDVCSKAFSRNEYLSLHMRTHTGEKPYTCRVCNTGFSRNDVLAKHIRTHRIRSKPFTCETCQEAFSWKRALLRHKHIHNVRNRGKRKARDHQVRNFVG